MAVLSRVVRVGLPEEVMLEQRPGRRGGNELGGHQGIGTKVARACWGCPWKVKGASVGAEEREGGQRGVGRVRP